MFVSLPNVTTEGTIIFIFEHFNIVLLCDILDLYFDNNVWFSIKNEDITTEQQKEC